MKTVLPHVEAIDPNLGQLIERLVQQASERAGAGDGLVDVKLLGRAGVKVHRVSCCIIRAMKAPHDTVVLFATGQRVPVGAEHRRIVVEWKRRPTRRQWRKFSGELLQMIREAEAMRDRARV